MERTLNIETFVAVAEMVAAQLRIKEADRWPPQIIQLKYVSFQGSYPEVTGPQLMWAAEQWIQSTATRDFIRYPTWDELMSPLFRSENGLANRSWGFRPDLPRYLSPQPWQLELLPTAPRSLAAPPDPANAAAYQLQGAAQAAALAGLPAVPEPPRLPPAPPAIDGEEWQNLLQQARDYESITD
jgi:hypothetical protein